MKTKEHQIILTRKPNGNYTIDIYVPSTAHGHPSSELITTMGASKNSPIGQCIKLLERLLDLAKKTMGGYDS